MELRNLYVAEFAALSSVTSLALFEIRTCQRTLFIGFNEPYCLKLSAPLRSFKGSHAYEFLLRFTCGLESQIKGETDVFGQTKTAVKNFALDPLASPRLIEEIESLFQRIFEDTKEIRSLFLHGIGGNTYGALSRRILNPTPQDKILLIGAGQISKSVAPYFTEAHLKIWNRSSDRLIQLQTEILQKSNIKIETLEGVDSLKNSIPESTILILATPAGSEPDDWVHQTRLHPNVKMLHLGGQSSDLAHFNKNRFKSGENFWTLSDLFALEKEQSVLREKQVQQAELACHNRAKLRRLARSIHIAHGWEDLALFS